jgi:hypothetical protein
MMDFEAAKNEAFESLKLTNRIEKVRIKTKAKYGTAIFKDFWKITVEVLYNEKVNDYNLLLNLKVDFPLSLPEIYLSEDDYEKIKYIPHVDHNRTTCLFDHENIKIDSERPSEIIRVCIQRAKKIITDGISKTNSLDFKDEVVAYWTDTYNSKDKVVNGYLGNGVDKLIPGKVKINFLAQSYNNTKIYLGDETIASLKVTEFFKLRGHTVKQQDAFYLGKIDNIEPPFYFNNSGLLSFIQDNFASIWQLVKSYINQSSTAKILIFSLEVHNELIFFGFYLDPISTKFNGWRQNSPNALHILSTIRPNDPVIRIRFRPFSYEWIRRRTDGFVSETNSLKFLVAGLGSIGSNLLFYLSTLEVSDFIVVDPEILQLENINRHLLSFNDVGKKKVDGISRYLLDNNPFLNIEKYNKSVVDVIKNHLSKVNEMDIIFCAIGKDSIENYLLNCLSAGIIKKPLILFWVEPYLLGSHILYINPLSEFKLKDLEQDGYYQFNIISRLTYDNPAKQLLLREAGCQGSYIPYGKEAIVRFFSASVPEIFNIIKDRPKKNMVLTYAGNLSIADEQGIQISDFGKQFTSNQLSKKFLQ